MARSLTRSNAHFRKAITRLPLGVSSNFRYWGEDKTIYVAGAIGVIVARTTRVVRQRPCVPPLAASV